MKKLLNILILASAALLLGTACDEDDNLFDKLPADRTQSTLARYEFALKAGGTWIMEYFPGYEYDYGGWIYIVEFKENNIVKAWFEGSTFITKENPIVESEYFVNFETGPMLRFATHNDYLHFFAVAGANGAGYQGWEGDHEFTIMSLSENFDEMILRGNKTGNRVRMTPLPGTYTPESYLEEIRNSQLAITRTEFRVTVNGEEIGTVTRPNLTMTDNFNRYAASKVWTITYYRDEPVYDKFNKPVLDENGEQLYKKVEIEDPLSVIYLPGKIMQIYAPYTFKRELMGFENQTMRTFQWQLGQTSSADCYVCQDSFLDIRLVP